jgi:hypothetical protein
VSKVSQHRQELKIKVGETDAAVTGFAGLPALVRDLDRLAQVAAARGEKRATLDFDASLFASGVRTAEMSYTGERGWMPMLCFWAELDLAVLRAALA